MKNRPSHTETSNRQMLEAEGATAEEAQENVIILSHRMAHDDMYVGSAPLRGKAPDSDTAGTFGWALNWTAINAVSAGKTPLVLDEARRFVEG